ncbi:4Fe-4S binding protein [bacterium]|nr:4Fe-4S binding protein [candidate division CSSED10-310 bacterium]
MARRKIIKIDEAACNGCGKCIAACSEGALELVNGKAKLVKEHFCDGFGDCLGECPTGALTIEEREADAFDWGATAHHIQATRGDDGLRSLIDAARDHGIPVQALAPAPSGCPGSRQMAFPSEATPTPPCIATALPAQINPSDLRQWPVQLHLVHPTASMFNHKELVVLSTCSPVASADIHWRFLRGRSVVVACPKLDRTEPYVGKLIEILANPTIPKVIIVRMAVPCCGGLTRIVQEAAIGSGRNDLAVNEIIVSIDGSIGTTISSETRQYRSAATSRQG